MSGSCIHSFISSFFRRPHPESTRALDRIQLFGLALVFLTFTVIVFANIVLLDFMTSAREQKFEMLGRTRIETTITGADLEANTIDCRAPYDCGP